MIGYTKETWPFSGTCVDCPQVPGQLKRPWECQHRDRRDHQLQGNDPISWESFIKNRERRYMSEWLRSPAATLGAIVAGCPGSKAQAVCEELARTFDRPQDPWEDPGDRPIPEDSQIDSAHPVRTGEHALYMEAHRMVSAKHSKAALVGLVNWLLHRIKNLQSSETG